MEKHEYYVHRVDYDEPESFRLMCDEVKSLRTYKGRYWQTFDQDDV